MFQKIFKVLGVNGLIAKFIFSNFWRQGMEIVVEDYKCDGAATSEHACWFGPRVQLSMVRNSHREELI